uniref:Tc1-like transposase DDE domain-containing protein n=1 Tax=Neobodo designis TaxID=312471 RepID=A0A7S1M9R8_NEODS|mmetsp:Transcript_3653/g.11487  ORF Transcript_3653/g.11487 Transcript_3653/m.11487 type:complete len:474 (+) Transcript_3653:35-1456(+)
MTMPESAERALSPISRVVVSDDYEIRTATDASAQLHLVGRDHPQAQQLIEFINSMRIDQAAKDALEQFSDGDSDSGGTSLSALSVGTEDAVDDGGDAEPDAEMPRDTEDVGQADATSTSPSAASDDDELYTVRLALQAATKQVRHKELAAENEIDDLLLSPQQLLLRVHVKAAVEALGANVTRRRVMHMLQRMGHNVRRESLRLLLHKMGYRWINKTRTVLLSPAHREARVAFAKTLLAPENLAELHRIIFTDEKFFTPGGVQKKTWAPKGKKVYLRQDRRQGVMGFLCINLYGDWQMYWYKPGEAINGPRYLETLKQYAACEPVWHKELAEGEERPKLIFQEDNAPCHTAATIAAEKAQALASAGFVTLQEAFGVKWPAKSPDLSPIENVWAWLDSQLRRQVVHTLPQMKAVVETHLNSKEGRAMVTKMIQSFVGRLQKCVDMDGENVQNVDPRDKRALPEHISVPTGAASP